MGRRDPSKAKSAWRRRRVLLVGVAVVIVVAASVALVLEWNRPRVRRDPFAGLEWGTTTTYRRNTNPADERGSTSASRSTSGSIEPVMPPNSGPTVALSGPPVWPADRDPCQFFSTEQLHRLMGVAVRSYAVEGQSAVEGLPVHGCQSTDDDAVSLLVTTLPAGADDAYFAAMNALVSESVALGTSGFKGTVGVDGATYPVLVVRRGTTVYTVTYQGLNSAMLDQAVLTAVAEGPL